MGRLLFSQIQTSRHVDVYEEEKENQNKKKNGMGPLLTCARSTSATSTPKAQSTALPHHIKIIHNTISCRKVDTCGDDVEI
jgi:hypothetical protein